MIGAFLFANKDVAHICTGRYVRNNRFIRLGIICLCPANELILQYKQKQ
nr:MAG TPA_asm: hypothetical protein [Caudoviricetes sp.]